MPGRQAGLPSGSSDVLLASGGRLLQKGLRCSADGPCWGTLVLLHGLLASSHSAGVGLLMSPEKCQ